MDLSGGRCNRSGLPVFLGGCVLVGLIVLISGIAGGRAIVIGIGVILTLIAALLFIWDRRTQKRLERLQKHEQQLTADAIARVRQRRPSPGQPRP